MTTLIPKSTPPFCHEWQRASHWEAIISSLLEELACSSSSSSSSLEPLSSSSKACGDEEGDGDVTKPHMRACHRVIQLTRVFTWHNLSLRVSRRASMHSSYTVMVASVKPPLEEEGAEEARGVAISVHGCFGRS